MDGICFLSFYYDRIAYRITYIYNLQIGRYFRLTCKLSCKPCELDYPTCEHKANGLWPWPQYPHDPDYMQCKMVDE